MDDRYIELCAAIIRQAMSDYKLALKDGSKKAQKTIKECERFFLSVWGQLLSYCNGELIIERCRREVEAEEKKE